MTIATFGTVALIGAALGFRFTVLILVPAIGFAVLGVASIGIAHGDQVNEMIITMILMAAVLQVGYLLGAVARTIVIFSTVPLEADEGPRPPITVRSIPQISRRAAS
jgi:hypothetical protein